MPVPQPEGLPQYDRKRSNHVQVNPMTDPQQGINAPRISLLQSNFAGSVLGEWGLPQPPLAYSVYGQLAGMAGKGALRFNAQWLEGALQGYLLGNGHRLYSPLLLRFLSPDALSPFDKGGGNAYAYCEGDPVNNIDPSGRVKLFSLRKLLSPDLKTGVTAAAKKLSVPKNVLKEQFRQSASPTEQQRPQEWIFTYEKQRYVIVRQQGTQPEIAKYEGAKPDGASQELNRGRQTANDSAYRNAMDRESSDGQRDYILFRPMNRMEKTRTES